MKKNIAVIFGGRSAEHDVSIITAHTPIIDSLQATDSYEVWPVYIAKDGSWYVDQAMNDLKFFKQDDYMNVLNKQKKVQLTFNNGLFINLPGMISKKIKIDVVFTAMHGTYGEDGSLMGLLRMADVPFVGCDLAASAVAMDKVLTKQVVSAEGVPVTPYVWFTKNEWEKNSSEIKNKIESLKYPLFIKPVHLGSSIGISKAKDISALENAIEVALHYDNKVLVEEGVENLIEVTLPIMGNDEPTLALIERPLNNTEFFDFNDKYLSGKKSEGAGVNNRYSELPAAIDASLAEKVKEFGIKTYKTLGCEGIARVDFLIDSVKNQVYVNEVNTLPGSLYAHNWKKIGVSSVELVTRLIALALERYQNQKNITFTFNSTILKQVGGAKTQ